MAHEKDKKASPRTREAAWVGIEALRKPGVPFETLIFPDDVHSFLVHARWLEIFERSAAFLDRQLRGER